MVKVTNRWDEIVRFASMWNMEGLVIIGFCEDYKKLRDSMRIPFVVYDGDFEETERIGKNDGWTASESEHVVKQLPVYRTDKFDGDCGAVGKLYLPADRIDMLQVSLHGHIASAALFGHKDGMRRVRAAAFVRSEVGDGNRGP